MEHYIDPFLWEGIYGDLHQIFGENVKKRGYNTAVWIFVWQVLGFLRWRFRNKGKTKSNMRSIWSNYLLVSFRSLKRHKVYFLINLLGLVLAISCSLYAYVYIRDEIAFDRHHSKTGQIHRLFKRYINTTEGVDLLTAETSGMMGPTIKEEYAQVENFTRVSPLWEEEILTYDKRSYSMKNMYYVDSTFFDIFDFEMIAGDPKTALVLPSSLVLSRTLAQTIFNNENPIGKTIIGLNEVPFTVTGIVEDPPRQSSFKFDALASWTTTVPGMGPLAANWMNNWRAQGIFTFLVLAPDSDPHLLTEAFPDMMKRHFPERADQYFLRLQPFEKIYLHSDQIRNIRGQNIGSIKFIYILGFSALLILIIASINYINVTLSRSTQNRLEVGIRKVMGSSRQQLLGRFIIESIISTIIASVIGLLLLVSLFPTLNKMTLKRIPQVELFDPVTILVLTAFCLVISVLIGIYPAYVQSAAPVSTILKRGATGLAFTGWFKKILLILQYSISIALIGSTLVIYKQTSFLINKPLGFDKERLMVVEIDNEVGVKSDVFEAEIKKHPNVQSVSITRTAIGGGSYTTRVKPEGYEHELNTRIFGVDQEFFETYKIETRFGRTFLPGSVADSSNLVVNESFVEFAGWEDPIGKRIRFNPDEDSYPVVGVVKDFHYYSLSNSAIEPVIMYLNDYQHRNATIKLGNGDIQESISHVENAWNKIATRTPFKFYFVDDWFSNQYQSENQLLQTTSTYSIISIVLCILGLYGLTALTLQQRTKEISIRKVLGASINSVVVLVNKQFVVIIVLGLLIATPLSYLITKSWLDQFAYRVHLNGSAFFFAGIISIITSVILISFLATRVASANPSENLSQE